MDIQEMEYLASELMHRAISHRREGDAFRCSRCIAIAHGFYVLSENSKLKELSSEMLRRTSNMSEQNVAKGNVAEGDYLTGCDLTALHLSPEQWENYGIDVALFFRDMGKHVSEALGHEYVDEY